MNRFDNPFHDLWITEILSPQEFVTMFSPIVALHSEEIFGTANVVVRGRQGSGKSMLLGLLNTRTRVAYARANEKYPAPDQYKEFIAAEVNLTRSNLKMVVSRTSELPEEKRENWVASTFADFLNYVLIQDLLHNLLYLHKEQQVDNVLKDEIPIVFDEDSVERFLSGLIKSEAWYGYLDDCDSVEKLERKISHRLTQYRRYFNFNLENLEDAIECSKTEIGESIAVFADCLRKSGIVPRNTQIYLRIDQHEELYELERHSGYGGLFRKVINQAVAMRDSRISYRIGTRHYAWTDELTVWGSGAHLENMRDYSIVDIDNILKRTEHTSSPFNEFAEDVFRRRLSAYGFALKNSYQSGLLQEVFGETLPPKERAKAYAKSKPFKLKIPEDWSPEWSTLLKKLWISDPLEAKFTYAWLNQQKQKKSKAFLIPPVSAQLPWKKKTYWMKERNEAALVQLAGETSESLIWSGKRHLVDLSGWNILAFMSICRAVWGAWLRRTPDEELIRTTLPKIGRNEQSVGVNEASRAWVEKLKEGGKGELRANFIHALGSWISSKIRADRALSNPGHTGVSLLRSEFEQEGFITDLIRVCRDNGDLIESDHTTKTASGNPRIKWYLNPLLCPTFRIPHIRTKEPIYTSVSELQKIYDGQVGLASFEEENEGFQQEELF